MRRALRPVAAGLFVLVSLAARAVRADEVNVATSAVNVSSAVAQTNDRPAGVAVLTLSDAITTALGRATEIVKARTNRELTGAQLVQSYFQFLPTLDVSAGYNATWGRSYLTTGSPALVETTNHGAAYQALATLNVFNGFADAASLSAARRLRDAADLSLFRAQQVIVLDITNAYLQVLLDRQITRIAQTNVEASRQRVELLQAQSDAGLKSLADLYRQQAQASSDELDFISTRNRAHNDLVSLLRRLRADLTKPTDISEVDFDVATTTAANPYADEAALMKRALDQRPDLRQAKLTSEAARSALSAARGGYYPRVDLFGSFGGSGRILNRQTVNGVDEVPVAQRSLRDQLDDQTITTVGATLTWGVFSRFVTGLNVSRAEAAMKNAAVDFDDKRLQVQAEVQQAVGDYETTLLQQDVAARGLRAAQQSYDAVQERYRVGASSIVDLLSAQAALVQSQAAHAQARIAFLLEQRTVQTVLGEIPVK